MDNGRQRHKAVVLWVAGLLAVALCVAGCGPQQDAALARRVLVLLAEGRYSARHLIDWEKFVALNQPVGEQYRAFAGEQDKLNFQRSFIDTFSSGFKTEGGDIKNFVNWRVLEAFKEPVRMTRVAADLINPNIKDVKLVFIFDIENAKGKRRLVRMEMLKIADEEAFREFERKARRAF